MIILAVIILACSCISFERLIFDSPEDVTVVKLGSSTKIPCNPLFSENGERYQIKTITWYKNSNQLPIYRCKTLERYMVISNCFKTLRVQTIKLKKFHHWTGGSTRFLANATPGTDPYLIIKSTEVEDIGGYRYSYLHIFIGIQNMIIRCHVIYKGRQQSNKYTNLRIICKFNLIILLFTINMKI